MTDPPTDLLTGLLADLRAEGDLLRTAVGDLDADGWARPTAAAGWSVADQIGHLAWTDEAAALAAAATGPEPDAKAGWDALVLAALAAPEDLVDAAAADLAQAAGPELLARWDASRTDLEGALTAVPAGGKMPWFGPPMSAASMATARFMETWAHGLDVHEALGSVSEPTDRIRHVAHLGVRTRDFAFGVHQVEPPAEEFRVELTAPSGATWTWGPQDADQRVTGPAYDFCRLVTQRVHRDGTELIAVGPDAERWLGLAQAFAGPPGAGRDPR